MHSHGPKAQPETARAVLIAVTGYGQDADRAQALAAGFSHHLVKPVSPEKLLDLLGQARSGPRRRPRLTGAPARACGRSTRSHANYRTGWREPFFHVMGSRNCAFPISARTRRQM